MSSSMKEISDFFFFIRYYNSPDSVSLAMMAKYKSISFQRRILQLHFLTGLLTGSWQFYFRTGTGHQRSDWPNFQLPCVLALILVQTWL